MLDLSNIFLYQFIWSHDFSSLAYWCGGLNWYFFWMFNQFCTSAINPTWLCYIIFFIHCWVLFLFHFFFFFSFFNKYFYLFKKFFWRRGPFLKSLLNLLLLYVLVFWPQGMWDLSFWTRDWTCTPCIGRQSLNHWTTREVPVGFILLIFCCGILHRYSQEIFVCSFPFLSLSGFGIRVILAS